MPAKSRKSQDITDDLKELASRAHAIRKQIEVESDTPEIIQIQTRIKETLSARWQGTDFADFCAQILTMTHLMAFLSKTGEADKLDFLQIHQILSKVPSINAEIAKMLTLLESWTPQWQDRDIDAKDPEDRITRVYELFLGVYDKWARDSLGTFYTPPPVVDFIVRSVDHLLQSRFEMVNGIMSGGIKVLDPASGTNVFLSRALRYYLKKTWDPSNKIPQFPREFLLDYETHEIQPAACMLGVFNILSFLKSTWGDAVPGGIPWKCLMNDTLELFGEGTADERQEGANKPSLLVVWGNPPYKKDSKTESPALAKAMKRYQDPVRFEKSLRVLSDYYIKFLRHAHERVLHAGQGMVALVLNSSYIDGPIHRGLRASLIQDFSEIYVVNLHGAIQPPEITPPGVTDENVFDIRTGVSILILVKTQKQVTPCQEVHYWDCWGTRAEKFEFLAAHNAGSVRWKTFPANRWGISYNQFSLAGLPPYLVDTYARGISIRNIFRAMVMGVTTGNDQGLVAFTREELFQKIADARDNLPLPGEMTEASIKEAIIPYNYRPLDIRYIFYVPGVVNRDRREVMKYLVGTQQVPGNVAIVTERFIRAAKAPQWNFIYATDIVPDKGCISNQDNSHVYPLYYGCIKEKQDNIRNKIIEFLQKEYHITITPLQIFDYIIALLSTPKFQATFSPLLGLDYPVILFPRDGCVFTQMVELGSQVKNSFLLAGDAPKTYFHPVDTTKPLSFRVLEIRYDPREERLWYAPEEYVEIPLHVWDSYLGYFHPIEHYFLDRVGRVLSSEEAGNINRAIRNLQALTQIGQELDSTYDHILEFLDCRPLLGTIIRGEFQRTQRLPIPGIKPGGTEISRVRKTLYLPDETILDEALR